MESRRAFRDDTFLEMKGMFLWVAIIGLNNLFPLTVPRSGAIIMTISIEENHRTGDRQPPLRSGLSSETRVGRIKDRSLPTPGHAGLSRKGPCPSPECP